ncbi:hypothetical protein FH972_014748 [Carpinus fangiana]|uniref:3-hydroxyacyl-CoA dehydrogenase NAD binding domain-containing protein n=1 Tax=Carpinus fangiana TaxID=176857 RepID=A0A5N6RAH9_9ROSI|nr:hypothetical protein FH972_014748 [Carpinus fangiana]
MEAAMDEQANQAQAEEPQPQSRGGGEEEKEEPRNEDEELIAKAQKLMEKITSSPENHSPLVLHSLASLLETQESSVKEGKMSEKDLENTISSLKGVFDYESFKDTDMVIEDAIENVSLKQQFFADLEKYCPPHCILASNTSTIDLSMIGERTKSQDLIVGAHFFR